MQRPVEKRRVAGGVGDPTLLSAPIRRVEAAFKPSPMTLVLGIRNRLELEAFLGERDNPASPNFRRNLTPAEFGDRFGRTREEYDRLTGWLEASGLSVIRRWPNRLQITFEGTAAAVERAFDVELNLHRLGDETAHAPNRPPAVPVELAPLVRGVSGLHGFTRFHPTVKPQFVPAAPGNIVGPADYAVVYNTKPLFDAGSDGTGVTIAIAARSNFNPTDPQEFRKRFNLPAKDPLRVFPFGPIGIRPGIEETEVVLDCEWSGAAAPDATVTAVIAPDIDFSLQSIVNNYFDAKVVSISFGGCERVNGREVADFVDAIFLQAAAQGQTVFSSSGDDGVSDCVRLDGSTAPGVNVLSSPPTVTGVGGTNLTAQFDAGGNAVAYLGETGWSGSGGGDSIYFPKPAYQAGVGVPDGTVRAVPDVALLAGSPGFAIFVRGSMGGVGGTSVSTPCWAGFCAVLNEAKQVKGLGNINPELYRLGDAQAKGTGPKVFRDVTVGNNGRGSVKGFDAQVGYDRVTGWGSFDGAVFAENFTVAPRTDTTPPLVSVVSPQGGEQLQPGKPFQLRWSSSDNVGVTRHDLLISTDGGMFFNDVIAVGLPGTAQSFDWMPSSALKPTSPVQVAVRAIDAGFNTATKASGTFTVIGDTTPPTVKVLTPNGGEEVKRKSILQITWQSSDDTSIASHDVLFSSDGGQAFRLTLASGLPGTAQSFMYNMRQARTKTARIQVVAIDTSGNQGRDQSDANFTIIAAPRFSIFGRLGASVARADSYSHRLNQELP